MDLSGKKAMVVGLGRSGLAVVRFLVSRGAEVRVNDQRGRESLGQAVEEVVELGAEVVLGGHPATAFEGLDLVVVSPGVPSLPELDAAERSGTLVIAEVELAARFIDASIIAVTGTNGKSTVTTLVGEMCARLGAPLFVGGNLGAPMIEAIGTEAAKTGGILVVELSSFQLERISELRAHVAVLLNVSADHLDRYPSFEAYAAAKARIFERQQSNDFAVLPADAPELRNLVTGEGKLAFFGGARGEVRVEDGLIVDTVSGLRVRIDALRLRGTHNVENACAAALAARLAGVTAADIGDVLCTFEGLPHRMQLIANVRDVEYIDDSKATNVGAAVASIDGLEDGSGKVVLIAGGVDKGGSYAPLRERMVVRGRAMVVIGEAAPLLSRAFDGTPIELREAHSMDQAVEQASSLARPGDTVLLAPACSSFDMFRSYSERGDAFQRAVKALGGRP